MTSRRWKKEWFKLCNPPQLSPSEERTKRKAEIEWEHRTEWMNEWAGDKTYRKSFEKFSSDKAECIIGGRQQQYIHKIKKNFRGQSK